MSNIEAQDHRPTPEGMFHGPFPPPEAEGTKSAQWIYEMANEDPSLYQLYMLREELIKDIAMRYVSDEVVANNFSRLTDEINNYLAATEPARLKQEYRLHSRKKHK